MRCPECKEEMPLFGEPQVALHDVKETGKEFPVKIVCFVYKVYSCAKCMIKTSKAESKDYKICSCKIEKDVENKELKPE